ncbi:hypothetical protein LB505_002306 [Fusarium chuoi]|nr:hypothetical protein LB505_002306 [Fusarium chuoi]
MASVGPEAQCLIMTAGKNWVTRSETFTFNVEPHDAQELHIVPQSAAHGHNGSVHVSYPQYFYDQSCKSGTLAKLCVF